MRHLRRAPKTTAEGGANAAVRPRVVLFDAYPHAFGGAQYVGQLLARRLPDHGWPALTIVPGPGRFVDRLVADRLPVEVVAPGRSLSLFGGSTRGWHLAVAAVSLPAYWWRLARRLRELRPSVVHISDLRAMVLAAVPARVARARVVWHIHLSVGGPTLNRLAAWCADAIVVPSPAAAHRVATGWPHTPIEVIPYPVRDEARRSSPVALVAEPVLVVLGRLHPQKGIDTLLQAAARLLEQYPALRVLIAGDADPSLPAERDRLEALANQGPLAGRVEFLGFCERTAEVIARGRVYVQPSRHEALPLAILEAMAVGVPIVATDVGGVSDVVIDGVTGLLVAAEDPQSLAAAVDRLLTDAALGERLRQAAFVTVNGTAYWPETLVSRVVAVYERLGG